MISISLMLIILLLGYIISLLVTHSIQHQYLPNCTSFLCKFWSQNSMGNMGSFVLFKWLRDYRNEGSVCIKWNCLQIFCRRMGRILHLPQKHCDNFSFSYFCLTKKEPGSIICQLKNAFKDSSSSYWLWEMDWDNFTCQ